MGSGEWGLVSNAESRIMFNCIKRDLIKDKPGITACDALQWYLLCVYEGEKGIFCMSAVLFFDRSLLALTATIALIC